jgi:hypothetical protein
LLAFIVGIAMMLNGTNLGGAVKGVFDDVAMVLAGGEEFDLNTPEGRHDADVSKMKSIAAALKAAFKAKNNNDAEDTRLNMAKNYVQVAVFPDGTTDIFIDGKGWVSRNPDLAVYGEAFATKFDLSSVRINYTDSDSAWKNGYIVHYEGDGNAILYKPLTSSDYNTYLTGGGSGWWYKSNISDPSLQ